MSSPSELLLPDLPPALDTLVRSFFPNEVLARRALLAPWPPLDFRSAWDEKELWRSTGDPARRRAFEEHLTRAPTQFTSVAQPFFKAEGTLGTVASPYAQLSDAEHWLYVFLWRDEATARRYLTRPLRGLGWETTLAFLDKRRQQGPLRWLLYHLIGDPLMGGREDPRLRAWYAHLEEIHSNFA